MNSYLSQLKTRHLRRGGGGIFAVCSAHPLVLRTALETALERDRPILIEATANQVNQFGGYTGMTPFQFASFISRLAAEIGLPQERVLIGADHLGPHVWKREPADAAMQKAQILIRQCLQAGFHKIHLDTGTGCADDPAAPLPIGVSVQRAAVLCRAAEEIAADHAQGEGPLYVIGNEVPTPGGGLEQDHDVVVTDSEQLLQALSHYDRVFEQLHLNAAWQRVMAVVAQPGVDFGNRKVAAYRPERAAALSGAHGRLPGMMTYEIHAADYQAPQDLEQMVRDHFILLKVGPGLTFAMRRALYALARIEADLPGIDPPADLIGAMEGLMVARPVYWQSHYRGTADALKDLRHHSLRDRIRYYWSFPQARNAVERLMNNLQQPLPAPLLEQHLPDLYLDIERLGLNGNPVAIVQLAIRKVLMAYWDACQDGQ